MISVEGYVNCANEKGNTESSYYVNLKCRFYKCFSSFFRQINFEIHIGFYQYFFHCCDKHFDIDDDLNHIKFLKVLLVSDIQSQPGPTLNGMPKKGRPKKIEFKSTPKKSGVSEGNNLYYKNVTTFSLNDHLLQRFKHFVENLKLDYQKENIIPLGLSNQRENNCFLNSVVQILIYYLVSEIEFCLLSLLMKLIMLLKA